MIYLCGDTHGEADRFTDAGMPGQSSWTEADILIVAGDFGYVFLGGDSHPGDREKLDALARKPYQILFVDGNHEGFPYLMAYPEEVRFGAPVRKIRDNIFWLQRGYVYTIAGHTFFVMGGAHSMDQAFRMQYYSVSGQRIWFEEELPSPAEYRRAIDNLKAHNMKVDYIVTHTAPRTMIPRITHAPADMTDAELTGFLEWIYYEADFGKWYFGHFHEDLQVTDQMIVCYRQVHKLC